MRASKIDAHWAAVGEGTRREPEAQGLAMGTENREIDGIHCSAHEMRAEGKRRSGSASSSSDRSIDRRLNALTFESDYIKKDGRTTNYDLFAGVLSFWLSQPVSL